MAELQAAARKARADEQALDGVIPPPPQSREAMDIYGGGSPMPAGWRPPDFRTDTEKMLDAEIGQMETLSHGGSEAEIKYGVPNPPTEPPAPPEAAAVPGSPPVRPERVVHAPEANVDVSAEREALLAAEGKVHEKDTEYYKQSLLKRARQRWGGSRDAAVADVEKTQKEAALAYARKLEERLVARQAERLPKYQEIRAAQRGSYPIQRKLDGSWVTGKERSTPEEFKDKVADRYRRMVIHKEVIGRSERAREAERISTLSEKEAGLLSRGYAWYARENTAFEAKYGKNWARVIRVTGFTAIGGLGGFALAGSAATLGAGVLTFRYGRALAGAFGSPFAGVGVGKLYKETIGKRKTAKWKETASGEITSLDDLAAQREAYLSQSPEAVEKQRRELELITTAALSGTLALWSLLSATEAATSATPKPIASAPIPPPEHPIPGAKPNVHGPAPAEGPTRNASVERPGTVEKPVLPPHVYVRSGLGAEAMLKDAWRQLHAPGSHGISAGIDPQSDLAKLYGADEKSINAVVHRIALKHPEMITGTKSVVVGEGSALTFDKGEARLTNMHEEPASHAQAHPEHQAPRAPRTSLHPAGELRSPATTILNGEELARSRAGLPPAHPTPTPPGLDRPTHVLPHTEAPGDINRMRPEASSDAIANQLNAREYTQLAGEQHGATPAARAPLPPLGPESLTHPAALGTIPPPPEYMPNAPFINQYNVPVDPARPGIYMGPNNGIMIYGGSYEEQRQLAEAAVLRYGAPAYFQAPAPVMMQGTPEFYVLEARPREFFGIRGPGVHHEHPVHPGRMPPPDRFGRIDPREFRPMPGQHPQPPHAPPPPHTGPHERGPAPRPGAFGRY